MSDTDYVLAVLADAPDVLWKFQENSGAVAADSSGNGRTGAISGSVYFGQPGPFTATLAYRFSGVNGKVHRAVWNTTVNYTLEAWWHRYDPAGWGGASVIVCQGAGGLGTVYNHNSNQAPSTEPFGLQVLDSTVAWGPAFGAIEDNTWHHAVCVVTLAGYEYWLDGARIGTWAHTPHASTIATFFTAGYDDSGAGRWWRGDLAYVAFYPTALTPVQIGTHWDAGAAVLQQGIATSVDLSAALDLLNQILAAVRKTY